MPQPSFRMQLCQHLLDLIQLEDARLKLISLLCRLALFGALQSAKRSAMRILTSSLYMRTKLPQRPPPHPPGRAASRRIAHARKVVLRFRPPLPRKRTLVADDVHCRHTCVCASLASTIHAPALRTDSKHKACPIVTQAPVSQMTALAIVRVIVS